MSIVGSWQLFFYKTHQITLYALREGLHDKALSISKDCQNWLNQSCLNRRSQWVSSSLLCFISLLSGYRDNECRDPINNEKIVNAMTDKARQWSYLGPIKSNGWRFSQICLCSVSPFCWRSANPTVTWFSIPLRYFHQYKRHLRCLQSIWFHSFFLHKRFNKKKFFCSKKNNKKIHFFFSQRNNKINFFFSQKNKKINFFFSQEKIFQYF